MARDVASLGALSRPQVRPPVAVDVQRPAGPGDHGVAGRQHLYRRSHGAGRWDVIEGQIPAQRVGVEIAQFARVGQGLALGREPQHPLGPRGNAVVERLDAELVPGAEQLPRLGVPDGEREHTAEPVHDVLADPGVGLEQNLGVAA